MNSATIRLLLLIAVLTLSCSLTESIDFSRVKLTTNAPDVAIATEITSARTNATVESTESSITSSTIYYTTFDSTLNSATNFTATESITDSTTTSTTDSKTTSTTDSTTASTTDSTTASTTTDSTTTDSTTTDSTTTASTTTDSTTTDSTTTDSTRTDSTTTASTTTDSTRTDSTTTNSTTNNSTTTDSKTTSRTDSTTVSTTDSTTKDSTTTDSTTTNSAIINSTTTNSTTTDSTTTDSTTTDSTTTDSTTTNSTITNSTTTDSTTTDSTTADSSRASTTTDSSTASTTTDSSRASTTTDSTTDSTTTDSTRASTATDSTALTTVSASAQSSTAGTTPASTPVPALVSPSYCHVTLQSNLFDCNEYSRVPIAGRSKSDDNFLSLKIPFGSSKSLCCRDPFKTVMDPWSGVQDRKIQLNCSTTSERDLNLVSAEKLHCSDTCNSTLSLNNTHRYYNLFLPLHHVSKRCQWSLLGVNYVTISANMHRKLNFTMPFLCLSHVALTTEACFNASQSANLISSEVYPKTPQPPQLLNLSCGGNCYLYYNWSKDVNFRSFKIEFFRLQARIYQLTTPHQIQSTPMTPSEHPRVSSSMAPHLEFRVTRGVLAGVLASAIILMAVAFCIWAYRSWHYRIYSSPLRRLFGRTPLHRLPTYSSRMFDLERFQLDQPRSRKASSATPTAAGAAVSVIGVRKDHDDLVEVEELDDGATAAVNRGFRM